MKRFHFPFDYKPKLDLKNTMMYSSNLRQLLFNHFQEKYRTIYVDPALLVTNKFSTGSHVNGDRLIGFDNKITNSVSILNSNQENHLMLSSLLLKNQNLLSYAPFIRRDAKQTNTESVFNWNINLDLAMPKENLTTDYFIYFIKSLFTEVIDIVKKPELQKIYKPRAKKIRPHGYSVISIQKLENDYPSLSIKEALNHYVSQHNFTVLVNNFNKTNSNQWLETPVLTAVDLKVNCGLYVYDETNDCAINIINIIKRPNGLLSRQQLNDHNPIELTNNLYDERIYDEKRPTNMGVSFNYTNLLFYLLDKIHLAEVVSSIWPDEFIDFIKQAKIEIF